MRWNNGLIIQLATTRVRCLLCRAASFPHVSKQSFYVSMRRTSPISEPCDQSVSSVLHHCTASDRSLPSLSGSVCRTRRAYVCAHVSASLLQMPSVEISRLSDEQKFPPLHYDSECPL
ncbi:hypothetical protein LZ31DRAFT_366249 [Colletotrichum somersetense]|nr:hypothetical protein LZ31DRAFT_366249 [Colletotrichum somersetense]